MAKILNFENFLSKKELAQITEFAEKEFAPVKLDDRRPRRNFNDYLKEQLQDGEFSKEYEAARAELDIDLRIKLKPRNEPPKKAA
jgi:hypothetical protein